MHLPPVQSVSYSEFYVSGDVTIHESAVVAPGVILNAAPNSRIVIGAGVCVGMGTVLSACHGAIEVEEGAVLGAGVLTIGQVKIGSNACIGSATTIFNASVDKKAVIPAGSLIGDTSRQVTILVEAEIDNSKASVGDNNSSTPKKEPKHEEARKKSSVEPERKLESEERREETESSSQVKSDESAVEPTVEVDTRQTEPELSPQTSKSQVIGQVYINQLLVSLFPERNSFKRSQQDKE
jgi:carbon dioxide concentrating mechanism protein CcmN